MGERQVNFPPRQTRLYRGPFSCPFHKRVQILDPKEPAVVATLEIDESLGSPCSIAQSIDHHPRRRGENRDCPLRRLEMKPSGSATRTYWESGDH